MVRENPRPRKRKRIEEKDADADCRLRYGLNVHCLIEIFKYLDCSDLWTLGGMNDHYKQIIDNWVIPGCKVKVSSCNDDTFQKIWQRHGKRIKRIQFAGASRNVGEFVRKTIRKCKKNQLWGAEFFINEVDYAVGGDGGVGRNSRWRKSINLEIDHFREVKTFSIRNFTTDHLYRPITFERFEALRVLRLYNVELHPNFDWSKLLHLTELELIQVTGSNVQRFDDNFIQHRPKLERFVHMHTFDNIQAIGNRMTKYCAEHMYGFHDLVDNDRFYDWESAENYERKYNFLGGFKCLKEVTMSPKRLCPCDITQALALLAQNNTLEKLSILLTALDDGMRGCFSHQNGTQMHMNQFTRLRTIHVHWRNIVNRPLKEFPYCATFCEHMKLFTDFSSQLLSNVETIIMSGNGYPPKDIDFLEYALRLRTLSIYNMTDPLVNTAIFRTFSIVRNILAKRSGISTDCRRGDRTSIDFIEMIVNLDQWSRFQSIVNVEKYIKFQIKKANACELPMCDKYYDARIEKNVDPVFPRRYGMTI